MVEHRAEGGGHRSRSAAEVDDDGAGRSQGGGLLDQQLRTAPGDEHPGCHSDPQAPELRPPQQVLQRLAGDAASHETLQPGRRSRLGHQQAGLVLGEDAPGGAEPGDDGVVRLRRSCGHGASRAEVATVPGRARVLGWSRDRTRPAGPAAGLVPRSRRHARAGAVVGRGGVVRGRDPGRSRSRRPVFTRPRAAGPRACPGVARGAAVRRRPADGLGRRPRAAGARRGRGAALFLGRSGTEAHAVAEAPAPTAQPLPPAGPTFPPGTVRIIDEASGISYPFLGDGWYEFDLATQAEVTSIAGQYFTTQELTPEGTTFIAQCTSGPLAEGLGWAGPSTLQSTTRAVADSVRSHYYPRPNERGVLRDEARTVDGHAAHFYEFQLTWDVPGYDASGERAALLLIDVGRPAPALLYISIPNTHAELYGVIDRVIDAVDVL